MKLWKISQETDKEYIDLMNNGIITFNKDYISFTEELDSDLKYAYLWLRKQYKIPGKYEFPWTLHYKVEGSTNPLNNKLFGVHSPGNYKALIFDIPDNQVLLYDDDLFIICLNRGYLSLSEKEDNEFDLYCKCLPKLGIDLYKVFDEEYFYKLNYHQQNLARTYLSKIYWSWKRIFNLNLHADDWVTYKDKTIYGLIWELRKEDIAEIIDFSVSEKEYNDYYNYE